MDKVEAPIGKVEGKAITKDSFDMLHLRVVLYDLLSNAKNLDVVFCWPFKSYALPINRPATNVENEKATNFRLPLLQNEDAEQADAAG